MLILGIDDRVRYLLWNCHRMNVIGFSEDKSILVQKIGLVPSSSKPVSEQYWPKSMSPYGVTRLQWLDSLRPCAWQHISRLWNHKQIRIFIYIWNVSFYSVNVLYCDRIIDYCQFSNIRRTQSPSINVSRLVLRLSLPNPLKPRVKLRMKE